MAINEFKPFAATAEANVQEQADYEQSEVIRAGFRTGLARSAEVNKAIRQASSIAAAVAEFTAEKSGKDMLDNGDIGLIRENFETALSAVSSLLVTEAGGTGDALTAVFTPAVKELRNGLLVHVRAREKNGSKTPTFKADETAAKSIVKGNNLSLVEGDIAGAGHWLELQYDAALDKWVLLNPAKGIVSQQSGVPVGTIEYFAAQTPPAGYLKADGASVGRETFPDLFGVIGTIYGEGDGETTFNLPDLMGRFAQGSTAPGEKIEAGAPNIKGTIAQGYCNGYGSMTEAFYGTGSTIGTGGDSHGGYSAFINLDASRSSAIYGNSETIQPPALTLLPCIKAFDAATNPGLIDITGLANEVNGKLDKSVNGTAVKYIIKTYNDGTNWYRQWSDGWLEQGGISQNTDYGSWLPVSLLKPFSNTSYTLLGSFYDANITGTFENNLVVISKNQFKWAYTHRANGNGVPPYICKWYTCGQGE